MKIVLVNYRYFVSGGPERYMFNIMDLLEKNNHEVIPFSIKHNRNEPSEYEEYFMDPIGSGDEVYGHEYKRDLKTVSKVIGRIIYSFEAKNKLKKLLKDVNPDLVYILHFRNKMSCSVVDAAKDLGIPVIHRISDFGYMCQNLTSSFYLYSKGEICEKCLHGSLFNNVKHRCVNDSYVNSFIKTASLLVLQSIGIKDKVDAFIFPSAFTMSKYLEYGVKPEKVHCIPTFFNNTLVNNDLITYGKFALFIGRIVPEKGLMTLVKAFENTDFNLKIIGFSSDGEYDVHLKDYLKDKKHNIEFLGAMNFNEIQEYLRTCLFTVVPSEWYDNLPNTMLESYAFSKCVVATNIGSLKEAVIENETGLLFEYKNPESLRSKIEILFNNPELAKQMGEKAFEKANTTYSESTHYNSLIKVFEEVALKKDASKMISQ
ncbi:glycosyltransferase family 4 protein [Mucilaginibacter endophyticus]|uniref:glycosyltransferase family 4 protein n=1 Tax=Mucilaginibacter endophyticus TaxID=2675003 RepID=UPI000E0DE8E3|nr:glycosyltransferase family 4 protein [Mucilaginibacter endophyticus]